VAGVVHIPWYATILRQDTLAADVADVAPLAMRYGANQYSVHRSDDDRYKILQMAWFESKDDWYRYWDGSEMIEFRRRHAGHYQVPLLYVWHDELTAGSLGPQVPLEPEPDPEPEPEPQIASS
jgi:hypothetical protein